VRPHGQTKLGFFPLPVAEARRLKNWLSFPERFSALDPCVWDGVAFTHLMHGVMAHRYGIESTPIGPNRPKLWESRLCRPTPWMSGARRRRCPCST
jgi:hypothetical protein